MNWAICVCILNVVLTTNGIAEHSGEKSFADVHPSLFVLDGQILFITGPQKDNIQMWFFTECSILFKTSIISL